MPDMPCRTRRVFRAAFPQLLFLLCYSHFFPAPSLLSFNLSSSFPQSWISHIIPRELHRGLVPHVIPPHRELLFVSSFFIILLLEFPGCNSVPIIRFPLP